LAEFILANGKF